jgi:GGDEF domain-containing protein
MIRRLFPTIVGLPIILCNIVQAGACDNLYTQEIGIALLCLLTIIVMGNFISWDAKTLGFIDYPALHHPLTGLGNRLLFNPKLSRNRSKSAIRQFYFWIYIGLKRLTIY